MKPKELAKEFVKKLKKKYEIFLAFLYGSVVTGEADLRHSDIDLLILLLKEKASTEERDEIERISEEFCLKKGFRADLIHSETFGLEEVSSTLFKNVLGEGELLYGQGKVYSLYSFSTSELTKNERADFHRKLFGGVSTYKTKKGKIRKEYKGLLKDLGGRRIGTTAFIIPFNKRKIVVNFLEKYNNLEYKLEGTYFSLQVYTR